MCTGVLMFIGGATFGMFLICIVGFIMLKNAKL